MAEAKQVATIPQQNNAITPMEMLQIAVERGADLAQIEKLMDLQERWEKNNARKAYNAAMQAFKENPPRIVKNKQVSFKGTSYKHAGLDQVCELIGKELAKHGISHSWQTSQTGDVITVTCTLTHVEGHSESVGLSGLPDNSGAKNSIQAVGSTVTYLQRYTLLAATGLATEDDDGRGASADPISDEQAATITDMIEATGTDTAKFLQFMASESISEIPAKDFNKAMSALRAKQKAAK